MHFFLFIQVVLLKLFLNHLNAICLQSARARHATEKPRGASCVLPSLAPGADADQPGFLLSSFLSSSSPAPPPASAPADLARTSLPLPKPGMAARETLSSQAMPPPTPRCGLTRIRPKSERNLYYYLWAKNALREDVAFAFALSKTRINFAQFGFSHKSSRFKDASFFVLFCIRPIVYLHKFVRAGHACACV